MSLIAGVFKPCDDRLFRADKIGKLSLRKPGLRSGLVNEFGDHGIDGRLVRQFARAGIVLDEILQNGDRVRGRSGLTGSARWRGGVMGFAHSVIDHRYRKRLASQVFGVSLNYTNIVIIGQLPGYA